MKKSYIFYIIAIIIILIVVFLSQQAYFRGIGKTFISNAASQTGAYLAKGSNWAMSEVYPKISGLPAQAGEMGDTIQNEISEQQNKVSENIGQKISNYFSGVTNSIIHPGTPQNCSTTPPPTASVK